MENDERMGGGLDGPANDKRARALALLSADPAYLRNALRAQGLDIVERGAGNVPPPLAPAPTPIADAYRRPRAVCRWPDWNGNTETLAVWRSQVRSKLRNDAGALPDAEGIIHAIQGLIPDAVQPRTLGWIINEEKRVLGVGEERWNSDAFLDHIVARCGDPQAAQSAARDLDQLWQGRFQPFRAFLQEFEVLQTKAESDGLPWTDGSKVLALGKTLHPDLTFHLIGQRGQHRHDYNAYVQMVAEIAGQLEARADRKAAALTEPAAQRSNMVYTEQGFTNVVTAPLAASTLDVDGDTIMLNRIIVALQNAGFAPRGGRGGRGRGGQGRDDRPRAPWRSREDYQAFLAQNRCPRCTRPGHIGSDCPTFRSPAHPGNGRGNVNANNVEVRAAQMHDLVPEVPWPAENE